MNSAIILAAGLSTRYDDSIPKQFAMLDSKKSVLNFSVNAFKKNKMIDEIIIIVPQLWKDKIRNKFDDCKVVVGGKTRSESSFIGLKKCSKMCKNVLIHDAARPLIPQKIINECIQMLKKYDAVIPIIENVDSMLKISNKSVEYLNRELIKSVQTPQGFNYKRIVSAYKNDIKGLDDMSVLLKNDKRVKKIFIRGSKINFKITNKVDLDIARKLL